MRTYILTKQEKDLVEQCLDGKISTTHPRIRKIRMYTKRSFRDLEKDLFLLRKLLTRGGDIYVEKR